MAATSYLGQQRQQDYRERIHKWAEEYCRRGWPAGTPEYLLRGYFRMLHAAGDIARLAACATDQARHDRMLDVTGGDTAALTEITDVQDAVLSLGFPDLDTMARLAMHRKNLAERNAYIPPGLPALWAIAGHAMRADGPCHNRPERAGEGAGRPCENGGRG